MSAASASARSRAAAEALRARRDRRRGGETFGTNFTDGLQGPGAAAKTSSGLRDHAVISGRGGMNLSDPEILELNELCNAVVDGTINDGQKDTLSKWLMRSEDARRFYVRVTGLSASLCHYAAEMQTGEQDGGAGQTPRRRWPWVIGLLSIAASVAVIIFVSRPNHSTPARGETAVANEV